MLQAFKLFIMVHLLKGVEGYMFFIVLNVVKFVCSGKCYLYC